MKSVHPTPVGCAQHAAEPLLECSRCRREGSGWLRAAVARYAAEAAEQRAVGAT